MSNSFFDESFLENLNGFGLASSIVAVCFLLFFILAAFAVVSYVFSSLSLYTIAKRRQIPCCGLAWVPLGNLWILGALADEYQTRKTGKSSRLRIWLFSLAAAAILIYICLFVYLFSTVIRLSASAAEAQILGVIAPVFLALLLVVAMLIACSVLEYICIYRLFLSCKPSNAVLYLLLTIFVNVTYPFLLFSCRNRDAL